MKRMNLRVEGITCSGCAVDVAAALKSTDGILDAEANYSEGTVTVDYHPDEIDEREVLARVRKLGLRL